MGLSGGDGTRNLTTMNNKTELNSTETHATIKLGIDAHAKWFYVARQVDGATPQPVRKSPIGDSSSRPNTRALQNPPETAQATAARMKRPDETVAKLATSGQPEPLPHPRNPP